MPEELKALKRRGQKVRDRLGQLSCEAAKISAEAQKVLVRPEDGSRECEMASEDRASQDEPEAH